VTLYSTPLYFDLNKTYYLAGPMTGYHDFNYPAFERAQLNLLAAGISVRSPHNLEAPDLPEEGEQLWQTMMRKALNMLIGCQGIILMPGWIDSKGALQELNTAASFKMPAYFLDRTTLIPMNDLK